MSSRSGLAKDFAFRMFRLGQRAGVTVLPRHYYVAVKDQHSLEVHRGRWARPARFDRIPGGDLESQGAWFRSISEQAAPSAHEADGHKPESIRSFGPGYNEWDGYFLKAFVRAVRPRRVIEIGAGVSTYLISAAAEQVGHSIEHTCIEPNPSGWLRSAPVRLVAKPVQDVDLSLFAELAAGDLLFVDSTHTVATGSDVNLIFTEVVAGLSKGVVVHVHDIFFPFLYSRHVMTTIFDWQESALVYALLLNSTRLRVLASLSMLDYGAPELLRRMFNEYDPMFAPDGLLGVPPWRTSREQAPSSLYVEVTDSP